MREWALAVMCIGIPYAVVVGTLYALLGQFWRARFVARIEDVALAVPIVVYIVLHQIRDRQGLYFFRAILITTATVCGILPVKGLLPTHRVATVLIVVFAGSAAAALSWHLLPDSGDMFKNAPGVW